MSPRHSLCQNSSLTVKDEHTTDSRQLLLQGGLKANDRPSHSVLIGKKLEASGDKKCTEKILYQ